MARQRLGIALAAILVYSVATVWVREQWAVSGVEVGVYLCATWCIARAIWRRERIAVGEIPAVLSCLAGWAGVQLWRHWTVVPAETVDAALYWLTAACAAWLGMRLCSDSRDRVQFLELYFWTGAAVCLLGLIQLFTSPGKIFWLFPSGFDSDVTGPFVSRNQYAAMVELLLPLALVLAGRQPRRSGLYLGLAAALVASVVASGSRAGLVIVLVETILILLLQRHITYNRGWVFFTALATFFIAVVGYRHTWNRFRDSGDPFEFRREFVDASVAMIRARPLQGFGFGTWPSAYRQFAVIDTGSEVNHSHNEWLQWTAEGGLPALGLMLAVAGLSAPIAVRSRWGLGVPAVFIHGLVDYPFLRLGLAVWIFVLLGALSGYSWNRRRLTEPTRPPAWLSPWISVTGHAIAIVLVLCGAGLAVRTAWADALYRQGTLQDLAGAVRLRPDRAEYELALAQADPEHSLTHLQSAAHLNPHLSEAQLLMAAQSEAAGDVAGSEATLLQLAQRDRLSRTAWALTNFYYRNGRTHDFWEWARTTARISPGELHPLLRLCFGVTDDAGQVLDRVASHRRSAERELVSFLLDRGLAKDAHRVALKMAAAPTQQDRDSLLGYVDRTISAGNFTAAAEIWNRLSFAGMIPYPAYAPGTLVNGTFAEPILDHGFDWRAGPAGCAVLARTHAEGPALELFLAASRPEDCEIYHQFLILSPGAAYELRFQYKTVDLPDPSGVRWSMDRGSGYEFRSSPDWTSAVWKWRAAAAAGRLTLGYHRSPGSTRHQGVVLLRRVSLAAEPGGG